MIPPGRIGFGCYSGRLCMYWRMYEGNSSDHGFQLMLCYGQPACSACALHVVTSGPLNLLSWVANWFVDRYPNAT